MNKMFILLILIQIIVPNNGFNDLCDSLDKLTIDSAVVNTTSRYLYLFAGNHFYQLSADERPVLMNTLDVMTVAGQNGPIKGAYFYHDSLQFNQSYVAHYVWGDTLVHLNYFQNNIQISYTKQSRPFSYLLRTQVRNDKTEIKLLDSEDPDSSGFTKFNGIPITAAFNLRTDSGKDLLHLFAGRQLCRMEVSEDKWLPFCTVQDISQWIDCSKHGDSNWFAIVIVVLVLILLVVFIAILIFVFLIIKVWNKPKNLIKNETNKP